MAKTETTTVASGAAAASEKKSPQTKWEGLRNFIPVEFVCAAYPPYHKGDQSCHTKLRLDAAQVAAHVAADHGGGFMMRLRQTDKPTTFWDGFVEQGFESADFRCEICDKEVPFHPNHILKHMKPHSGKRKRLGDHSLFNLTIRVGAPTVAEDDAFETFG